MVRVRYGRIWLIVTFNKYNILQFLGKVNEYFKKKQIRSLESC